MYSLSRAALFPAAVALALWSAASTVSHGLPNCEEAAIGPLTVGSDCTVEISAEDVQGVTGDESSLEITLSETELGLGSTEVVITAEDDDGTCMETVTVEVVSETPPVPEIDALPPAEGECEVTLIPPTAVDICGNPVTGTTEQLNFTEQGEFMVVWTYTDASGNSSTQEQTVIVDDDTPPMIIFGNGTEIDHECGTDFDPLADVSAVDTCDGDVTDAIVVSGEVDTGDVGGVFTLTYMVEDSKGNKAVKERTVEIVDTTPPMILQITASPDELWPPNHDMVEVSVSVSAEDNCDAAEDLVCEIDAISSNEAPLAPGSGRFAPDWLFTDDPLVAELRAERAGPGDGRVYTLGVTCRDGSGNEASGFVEVFVPHDQGDGRDDDPYGDDGDDQDDGGQDDEEPDDNDPDDGNDGDDDAEGDGNGPPANQGPVAVLLQMIQDLLQQILDLLRSLFGGNG